MKYILTLRYSCLLLVLLTACVDDFEEANPGKKMDGPAVFVTSDATDLVLGEETTFTVNVLDAPGLIDSVGLALSENLGMLTLDQASFNAVKGKTSGTFTVLYTAPTDRVGEANVSIEVFDQQNSPKTGKKEPKSGFAYLKNSDPTVQVQPTVTVDYIFDQPVATVTPGAAAVVNRLGGQTVTYTINMTNVPGGIGGIDATILQGGGTLVVNQTELNAVIGKTGGVVTAIYTAPNTPGAKRFSFTVFDNSPAKRPRGPFNRTVNVNCAVTDAVASSFIGAYKAESSGDVGLADSTYSITSTVTITQPTAGTGIFSISDISFGMYEQIYDRATKPEASIHLCDGTISGQAFQDKFGNDFTVNGTLNADGTLSITWENTAGDSGTVTLTKL